jgi:alpha-L-rhamnosidase
MQRIARILGKENDAARFGELFEKIKDAFQKEFVTRTGRVGEDTQTAYVLALQFDLLPEGLRQPAAARLAADVRSRGHLTTGFLGTPYICHVLTRFGYLDLAYLLLNREEYPSWLYPVKQGATTIWERWDGQKPDGTFQDRGMNSFNHYAYGAIGDWMYSVAAGIEIDVSAPGYKHILIQPQPGGGLTRVRASHLSPYGKVSSDWELNNQEFQLVAELPTNTRATIRLPGALLGSVNESGKPLAIGNGITAVKESADSLVVDVGSGRYVFSYTMKSSKTTPPVR